MISLWQGENVAGQDILIDADSAGEDIDSLDPVENLNENSADVQTEETNEVYVHVVGAVERPGVYKLPEGARVVDAINKAVATSDARLDLINLAAPLPDGVQVTVWSEEEYQKSRSGAAGGKGVPVPAGDGISFGVVGSAGNGAGEGLVNINTAAQGELETLPGIGPALAGRIIDYRENTRFLSPEDIKNVSGIGDKRFEQIEDKITVN